jgi:aspartyl aminopeptidase
MSGSEKPIVDDLVAFLDASPTPYHAVNEVQQRLEQQGFRRLDEREPFRLEPGSRAYVTRAGSLIAFRLGTLPLSEGGFVALGAHTDSPNLRLRPQPDLSAHGYAGLGAEVYGGVLLTTWLDRDLSLAGRVTYQGGQTALVRLPGAPCRIPNLAIHLDREVNRGGLVVNPQTALVPVFGRDREGSPSRVLELCARELDRGPASEILSFDLCLFDVQGANFGGQNGEFLFSARLDNLASCHAATVALSSLSNAAPATAIMALYDHEEVGSQSAVGARSAFLSQVLERITFATSSGGPEALARAMARSLFVSLDMAHAVHPNFADKHDKQHRPLLGEGPVIKVNTNQSYATDSPGQALFVEACQAEGVKPQFFVARNDIPCGSTIGPIVASRLGLRTIDVGNPMLSMHSCREMAGTADHPAMVRVLSRLLTEARALDPAY